MLKWMGEGWKIDRAAGATLENRRWKTEGPSTCLQSESNGVCASASSQGIPIILRALDSTESRRDGCDAGVTANGGEQYSIELWKKALYTESISEFSK